MSGLHEQFGQIDIYFFDQLLRGRIAPGMRVVDAGCGSGRNLVYLLREGYEVFGADADAQAVESVRRLAASLAPNMPASNFHVEAVEEMAFPDGFADVASLESGRSVLLPPGILDRNGEPGGARGGTAVPLARRVGALSGG